MGRDLLVPTMLLEVDPILDEMTYRSEVDTLLRLQVTQIMGTPGEIEATAAEYFETVYHRLPIVSKDRCYERLASLSDGFASADFAALCLSFHLILQQPLPQTNNMQSPLYMTVKNIITLLESTNYVSLEVLQVRLIVCFYEIGHGISPANSISIGACSKLARAVGLNKIWLQPVDIEARSISDEEKRRVWWAVFNLDR